jgi:EAL domain-containing protein (putative c-di-GMP-specific phosphodiesterase class I)
MQQERIQVHYQPIVRLSDMRIVGAEALAHWHHPARGLIPAEVFVPVAEQNGMIVQLGQTVFEIGIADWKALAAEPHPLALSFNLSAAQFVAHNHIASLLNMLADTRLGEKHRITIEITESLKLFDSADYLETLNRFRACGCLIAIDDFGTGHSSLSYLTRIPVDIIKIDKSFVQKIASAPNHAAMVRAILQMAASFELETVAEGVETTEQLEFLKAHGCGYAQGFLLAHPMPFDEFQKTLQQPHINARPKKTRRAAKKA